MSMILFVEIDRDCPPGLYGRLLEEWQVEHTLWRSWQGHVCPSLATVVAVIILGGAMGVNDAPAPPELAMVQTLLRQLDQQKLPCLAICLGAQLLAATFGGSVHSQRHQEKGCRQVSLTTAGLADPLFAGLPATFAVFHWHNDSFDLPAMATHLAFSPNCPGQALRYGRIWGVQFHPEIDTKIADCWWQKNPDPAALPLEFRRREEEIQHHGSLLLQNFLHISGLR